MSNRYQYQEFRLRGQCMTRIETSVAASFAIATVMLVVGLGTIPEFTG